MTAFHADHVGVLVVGKVRDLLPLLQPRVPDDSVGKVVFLREEDEDKSNCLLFLSTGMIALFRFR